MALDEKRELGHALSLTAGVLALLTIIKPLGAFGLIGTVGYTLAALAQLYLPIWRADRLRLPLATFGLSLVSWRRDLMLAATLCAVTFPLFALGHHLYMTAAHDWLVTAGLPGLARYAPRACLAFPAEAWFAPKLAAAFVLTHTLGVALPEEAFYRGYLQPRLEHRWPARRKIFGVPMGRAVIATAALFALGHFLGEWNPLRLGPFFPALLFAWLRGATGTITGAVAYHAACNIFGALLYGLYRPC